MGKDWTVSELMQGYDPVQAGHPENLGRYMARIAPKMSIAQTHKLGELKTAMETLIRENEWWLPRADIRDDGRTEGKTTLDYVPLSGLLDRQREAERHGVFGQDLSNSLGITSGDKAVMMVREDLSLWDTVRVLFHEYGHLQQSILLPMVAEKLDCECDIENAPEFFSFFMLKHFGVESWPTTWRYMFGYTVATGDGKKDYDLLLRMVKKERKIAHKLETFPEPTTPEEAYPLVSREIGVPSVKLWIDKTIPKLEKLNPALR